MELGNWKFPAPWLVAVLLFQPLIAGSADDAEYFEKKIRPLLAEHCYACHSSTSQPVMGGLILDQEEGFRKGGSRGSPVVTGDPESSLLIRAVTHQDEKLRMPLAGRLPDEEIALLTDWVRMGRPLGRHRRSGLFRFRGGGLLGLRAPGGAVFAADPGRRLGSYPHRPIHPGSPGSRRAGASAGGGPADPHPSGHLRPDRSSPHHRRDPKFPPGPFAGSVPPVDRTPAVLAALRRALGPPLAGRGPLRRFQRTGREHGVYDGLPLPGLRGAGLQPGQALRSVRAGAAGGRPPARYGGSGDHAGALDGHRIPLPGSQDAGRRRPREDADGHHRRTARHQLPGVPGSDHGLRPLPRPQVRSHLDQGLLLAGRNLQELQDHGAPRRGGRVA